MSNSRALFITNDRLYREIDGVKQAMIVKLMPSYETNPDNPNHVFWKTTPIGMLEMTITNPDVFDLFVPNKKVWIDFTFVE